MRLLVSLASSALVAAVAISAIATVPATPGPSPSERVAQVSVASAIPTLVRTAGLTRETSRSADPSVTDPVPGRPGAQAQGPAINLMTPHGGFTWPLSPRPFVRRYFEPPKSQWSRGHRGVDLLASVGQQVVSAGEGVVTFSGVVAGRGVISVRHSGGPRTTYEPVDGRLPSGTLVHRGETIGLVSSTPGHCVPLACVHWGAIWGQTYRDPLSLLGFGRPILLPLG